ncbi:MAG TPA: ribonuclease III [Caulobacteraceae bacterium]|jgi:ribonuclease-3|nr:ribonuclease III [Caulobacteraceae bacterium]
MDRRAAAVEALQARLGHAFADPMLLDRALTHASVKGGPGRHDDNERLEFLGDRVLGLAMADAVGSEAPDADPGELARRFASLVSRTACARVAREIALGEALRLPGGETRRGARENDTILADACEAVIAAVFLEAGYEAAAAIIRRLWTPLLAEPLDREHDNPKSALQERAAAAGLSPPTYQVLSRTGPDHAPLFVVEARLEDGAAASGEGASLQAAQKAAALALLKARGE